MVARCQKLLYLFDEISENVGRDQSAKVEQEASVEVALCGL
ncbi:MAG TPA: hypothetical protein VN666_11205 [Nitrospira sp.]|nr:hypothetical protein [Nitrospira sp.]